MLRRSEEERVDAPPRGKTPLEPRINHPNNRAVPSADSPKRAPTLRNSVFRACVQGGRFLDCYRNLSPRKIGGERRREMRLFLTRHRRVNTVSSMRDDRVATNRGKLVLL